jgi:hypothetical protein
MTLGLTGRDMWEGPSWSPDLLAGQFLSGGSRGSGHDNILEADLESNVQSVGCGEAEYFGGIERATGEGSSARTHSESICFRRMDSRLVRNADSAAAWLRCLAIGF